MAPPPAPNRAARRAAVAAALAGGTTLTGTQCQALAAQFGCSATTIARDVHALCPLAPPAVHTLAADVLDGAADAAHGRDVALLRLLGRLEVVPTPLLQHLIAPDLAPPNLWRHLARLRQTRAVGCQRVPATVVTPPEAGGRRTPPPTPPLVWWLTPHGRERLAALDVEADLDALRVHRADATLPPEQLTHDLRVTAWCASVITEARRCRLLQAVHCQVEYISARHTGTSGPAGAEQQRLDALLILIFERTPQPPLRHPWTIPWHTGAPVAAATVVRLALGVDRGTEGLKILLGKALTYRTLTTQGHYARTLGGEIVPVVLTPTARRAGQIAREWQHAWPGGAGVSSTFKRAIDPTHGALWGQYLTMTDVPARPTTLLGTLVPDVAAWRGLLW